MDEVLNRLPENKITCIVIASILGILCLVFCTIGIAKVTKYSGWQKVSANISQNSCLTNPNEYAMNSLEANSDEFSVASFIKKNFTADKFAARGGRGGGRGGFRSSRSSGRSSAPRSRTDERPAGNGFVYISGHRHYHSESECQGMLTYRYNDIEYTQPVFVPSYAKIGDFMLISINPKNPNDYIQTSETTSFLGIFLLILAGISGLAAALFAYKAYFLHKEDLANSSDDFSEESYEDYDD